MELEFMDQRCKEQLEFANKLIFVKKYEEADRVLREILASPQGAEESLIHLRRIELMSLLGKLSDIRGQYQMALESANDDGLSDTCLVLIDMFTSPEKADAHMARLHDIAQVHGPSAIVYFAMGFGAEQQGRHDRARYN